MAMHPEEPLISEFEGNTEQVLEHIREIERNDMNITAVPLTKLLIAINYVEPCEVETVAS